jgi:hypothetical protein
VLRVERSDKRLAGHLAEASVNENSGAESGSTGLSLTLPLSPREREHVAPTGLKMIKSKITIRIKNHFQPAANFNY